MKPLIPRHLRPCFLLILVLIGLDQATKQLALAQLALHEPLPLLPLLNLNLVYNPGAAFSFLSQAGGWQRWFFITLALCISIVLAVWLTRLPSAERWARWSLSLVLAGAVGNLIDRIAHGYVIDFIDFYYPTVQGCLPLFDQLGQNCHWPTFNVADSAISVGGALLLLGLFFEGQPKPGNRE